MSKQVIKIGTTPNDHSGDAARTAFAKVNENFDEVYASGTTNATAITAEAAARAAADVTHTAAIAAEATARAAADTALQSNIASEASTRAAADTTNANAITAEAGTRATADTIEATARATGDAANAAAITSEGTARAAADTTNANAITAEASARAAADITLQNNINGKEPTQAPASQAEAESGTETGIRKWSPLRVAQAIAALGGGGSAGSTGLSAYEIAVNNGFIGDEAAWLASLVGADGNDGNVGADGSNGSPGWSPQFAVVSNGALRVLQLTGWTGGTGENPGSVYEYVGPSGFTSDISFALNIRGETGETGGTGSTGETGSNGEVSNADLATAIAGTSDNSNAVNLLAMTVSDPPTPVEVQAIADKLDELITALRR